MNHIIRATAAFLIASSPVSAVAYTVESVTDAGRTVRVTAITDNIIRVSNYSEGENEFTGPASVLDTSKSTATVTSAKSADGRVEFFTTASGVDCSVNTRTGGVTIMSGANSLVADNGVRVTENGHRRLDLYTTASGSFYGAGERGHRLNLRGDTLVMYNRQNYGYTGSDPRISQMNITMPLFLSTDGFALVFDDYAAAEMILSNPISYISESNRPVSYYYVSGVGSLAELTGRLTELTGRQDLPPFWAMGYITSKYGYHDRAETLGTIDTLRRHGYPVDGIVLDLYWYGKEQDMGRLDWEPSQWPDHARMLDKLKKQGVNLIAISQPYVLRNGKAIDNYRMADSLGLFVQSPEGGHQEVEIWVGEGGMWDMSNADTRKWLYDRYKALTDGGVTGWWGDLGEPEVHPETGIHANGLTARQYHNQYGNDWSSVIYELFKKEYPETRLMTMMRGGTTGLQRYNVYPWSTDVSRSWGGLAPQIIIMLNSGLSGLGYMGHDVGGFAVDPEKPYDAELYVRWLQLGLFSPILRTHAQLYAEPYNYPQHEAVVKSLVKERYRWLPYNYTLAYENASKGWPLVRPLEFHGKATGRFDNVTDEYLWGRDVLVAPVMTQGATSRRVVFPAGQWYDYNNPARVFCGGDTIEYDAPLEMLPLFVRAGAFLPSAEYAMRNTGDYNPGEICVSYYRQDKGRSSFTMYDDDRLSAGSLAEGRYRLTTFTSDVRPDGSLMIELSSEGSYKGASSKVRYSFVLYGFESAPAVVDADGKNVKFTYDSADRSVRFTLVNPLKINIR
ncbi:MAG: DUF5110 domain-containing protein [Muribaculaceae bacterium]|nr:DUF5110 domain-containing protein [Muribaculaceae bacterium]